MRALFDSVVRTFVPIIVGFTLALFTSWNITPDPEFEAALTAALTAGFSALYYLVVRLFEVYVSPKLGWLLGLAKTPEYTDEKGKDDASISV